MMGVTELVRTAAEYDTSAEHDEGKDVDEYSNEEDSS